MVEPESHRVSSDCGRMLQSAYRLGPTQRNTVLSALRERCIKQKWTLLAAHVRSSHVHVVVTADARPERIMNDLKSFASRRLNELTLETARSKTLDSAWQRTMALE